MNDPITTFVDKLNRWGSQKKPFVFLADYDLKKPVAWLLDEQPDELGLRFDFDGFRSENLQANEVSENRFHFHKFPESFETYKKRFDHVVANLKAGNSFLLNLSVQTPVETNLSLSDIFERSEARFRFLMSDEFVCFSPEIFVRIENGRIASFPMKGTIDASLPNAREVILNDEKEKAEHATIVDLIRNDLSMVAERVWVERYRYIEEIVTNENTLLQVSSEVAGTLPVDFDGRFGDLLLRLLPAGSICGAPKPSTLRIIQEAENYERGYYTGVMGYFDGLHFESAVMIRYIEKQNGKLVFKSGGGITAKSDAQNEYQEVINKVYLPIPHDRSSLY